MEDEKIDGWSDDVQDTLEDVLAELESVSYEIHHCIRGCHTKAHNNEQLAEYLKTLSEELLEAAESIADLSNDEYDNGDGE